MPASARIAWISSASPMSSATATCTIAVIALSSTLGAGLRLRDGLGRFVERSSLEEARSAPCLERNLDDIEVLRNDRLGEDGARLARHLAAEIARRQVRQRQQAHVGLARELGRVERGRVGRLPGPLLLL